MGSRPKLLIIGGQFSGIFTAHDMKNKFQVCLVDAKEFFEYTPGVLRAFVKPSHFDSLSFTLQPILEVSIGVKYIWGEVKKLDGPGRVAHVKPMFVDAEEKVGFDYCIICAGCNFGPFAKNGESLWFPTIHEHAVKESMWKHIDERFIEGRRRHILEEYHKITELNNNSAQILVVGAGFIGVEWVTELKYYFPKLDLTIIDFLPNCLGPLPPSAAGYCSKYMKKVGIHEYYNQKYDKDNLEFWKGIGFVNKEGVGVKLPDKQIYVCIGVKASNYFMPAEVLSDKGPGGGGWIHFNWNLQVTKKPAKDPKPYRPYTPLDGGKPAQAEQQYEAGDDMGEVWADGRVFAVGDCNYGCIGNPSMKTGPGKDEVTPGFLLHPIPKISYPGEEQALHACHNIERMAYDGHTKAKLMDTWWPWGAGMFATSLGPHDACFVMAANHQKCSGYMVNRWKPAAWQKEIIEISKINECKDGIIGKLIWYFVHHTPFHLWGGGHRVLFSCCHKGSRRGVIRMPEPKSSPA